ncbi:uncharacterized protein KY384_007478 [Bacidia gigantensis]|uniref:uncharacterized protein n=1 Tax=Bacidia gigantensis TaxID=2732470 RepID=UPI001D044E3B|nr:uncharacterized protein KY384_007478 [Bacidia gigantensis]KAG8527326.1 hypothetical protein KY384_007478 [Bacidia gigantensis]
MEPEDAKSWQDKKCVVFNLLVGLNTRGNSSHLRFRKTSGNEYGQRLDIWMLGLALARQYYGFGNHKKNNARNKQGHDILVRGLREDRRSIISPMLADMLAWDALHRPSARQLLAHPEFGLCKAPAFKAGSKRELSGPAKAEVLEKQSKRGGG